MIALLIGRKKTFIYKENNHIIESQLINAYLYLRLLKSFWIKILETFNNIQMKLYLHISNTDQYRNQARIEMAVVSCDNNFDGIFLAHGKNQSTTLTIFLHVILLSMWHNLLSHSSFLNS